MKKKIVAIIGVVMVLGAIFFFVSNKSSQLPSVDSSRKVFTSKLECENETGKSCVFEMCDYIPEGKTPEEVCGPGGAYEGWVPNEIINL